MHPGALADEEATKAAAMWGPNLVHPTNSAYHCMADHLERDILNTEAHYTNLAKPGRGKRS